MNRLDLPVAIRLLTTGRRKAPIPLVWLASSAWLVFIFVAIWQAAASHPGWPVRALRAQAARLVGIVRMAVAAGAYPRPA